ncbi:uncharacterized protein LOC122310272 [Carya illinoinensis]|uniref:uncharacterized protein LOC122310272 n=1 Tax=Carya illinoinensis TaxID=32201 RepID=UPI001C71FAE4|nr:uncharacterized protein LOC122310272 [Carya illinoinensis]
MAGNRISFSEVWKQMIEILNKEELAEAALIVRLIWFRRNNLLHENSYSPPGLIIQAAKKEMKDFKEATGKPQINLVHNSDQTLSLWKKPPENFYKLNWGTATDKGAAKVGIGAIIRDSNGQVIGSLQATRQLTSDQFTAESYALLIATTFSKEIGTTAVIVEGETQKVLNLLGSGATDWSQGGLLVEEAKAILNSCLSWSANLVNKEANKAASSLARNALVLYEDLCELEEISNCILSTVLSEMM